MSWMDIVVGTALWFGSAVLFFVAAGYRETAVARAMDWFLINARRMKKASEDDLVRVHLFYAWFLAIGGTVALVACWLAGFPAVRGK